MIMENSYRFFENRYCRFYPCHEGISDLNCMFCYCPFYQDENCPGNPEYKQISGKTLRVCTECLFPHLPENYDVIMDILRARIYGSGMPDK